MDACIVWPSKVAKTRRALYPRRSSNRTVPMSHSLPSTLGELTASGYAHRSVKDEMRHNLVQKLKSGEDLFPGVQGYGESVVPQIVNAVLAPP